MSSPTNACVGYVRLVLSIGLIVTLVVAISAGLRFARQGGHVLSVQTASMLPTIKPGDAVIAWHVAPSSLRVGEVVSYHSLRDPRVIISHRIVSMANGRLVTRGDANTSDDPAITAQSVVGQVTAVAPGLGRLLGWIRTPLGLAILVYVPALGVVAIQARRLVKLYQPPAYRLNGHHR